MSSLLVSESSSQSSWLSWPSTLGIIVDRDAAVMDSPCRGCCVSNTIHFSHGIISIAGAHSSLFLRFTDLRYHPHLFGRSGRLVVGLDPVLSHQ